MPILWAAADEDVDAVLSNLVVATLGSGQVELGRLCPVCGSSDHGRPWARHGGVPVPVSVARSGAHLLVVAEPGATAVGVDVESAAAVERAWPSTVLSAGESAETAQDRLELWVAKEAILKADGTGLTVPMDQVVVAEFDGELRGIAAPAGFGAAVALRR